MTLSISDEQKLSAKFEIPNLTPNRAIVRLAAIFLRLRGLTLAPSVAGTAFAFSAKIAGTGALLRRQAFMKPEWMPGGAARADDLGLPESP